MSTRSCALLLGVAMVMALEPVRGSAQDTDVLYSEACEGGDLIACNVFGLMLETGAGVPMDRERAASVYRRACEGGELIGCTRVGFLYVAGTGVPVDTARAAGLFRVACEGGEAAGCRALRSVQDAVSADPTERHDKVGRVGDATTGEPLGDVLIEIVGRGTQAISDETGHVTFDGLPAGAYRVKVQRAEYEDLDGVIEVPGDERFFVLMTRADVADPHEVGRIVGRISEGGSRWLSDVEITVLGQPNARSISNRDGRFTVRNVEPGLVDVRLSHLGYAPRSVSIVVQPGRTVEVAATMFIEPIELEPIQVTVRSSFLEQNGFYRRAERGTGTYITAQQIEERDTRLLSEVLVGRVPGLRIQYGAYDLTPDTTRDATGGASSSQVARAVSSRSNCPLTLYVDGRREMLEVDLDFWPPHELEAIEVYTGIDMPIEYATNLCGVILLWTRRGA